MKKRKLAMSLNLKMGCGESLKSKRNSVIVDLTYMDNYKELDLQERTVVNHKTTNCRVTKRGLLIVDETALFVVHIDLLFRYIRKCILLVFGKRSIIHRFRHLFCSDRLIFSHCRRTQTKTVRKPFRCFSPRRNSCRSPVNNDGRKCVTSES